LKTFPLKKHLLSNTCNHQLRDLSIDKEIKTYILKFIDPDVGLLNVFIFRILIV
jgi:hypothetical protein